MQESLFMRLGYFNTLKTRNCSAKSTSTTTNKGAHPRCAPYLMSLIEKKSLFDEPLSTIHDIDATFQNLLCFAKRDSSQDLCASQCIHIDKHI